ncbi:xylanase A [Peziza echinospora]|nr:xylanase A [Peziza echinospora]
MISLTPLLAVAAVALAGWPGVLAAPSNQLSPRSGTPSASGTNDGFYYKWWTDGGANATYTNGDGGQYSLTWSSGGELVGGKGWNPGTNTRNISYSGTYRPSGNSILGVYGWTLDPPVEYHIIDNWGSLMPSAGTTLKGAFTSDGGTYNLSSTTRRSRLDGTVVLQQFWAVRQQKRSAGGCITFGNFMEAWRNVGLDLGGVHGYQIVATDAYDSSGSSEITVAEGCS